MRAQCKRKHPPINLPGRLMNPGSTWHCTLRSGLWPVEPTFWHPHVETRSLDSPQASNLFELSRFPSAGPSRRRIALDAEPPNRRTTPRPLRRRRSGSRCFESTPNWTSRTWELELDVLDTVPRIDRGTKQRPGSWISPGESPNHRSLLKPASGARSS